MKMDTQPIHLNIMFKPEYAVPVFGYVVPPIAGVVLIVNITMVWILFKKNMRTPANQLLVCMAFSDTVAILFPVVPFVYFYTMGNYEEFVPYGWCRSFYILVHILPLMFNMASLWSTVTLAVMRCYSVWRPLKAKQSITFFRTNLVILGIFVFSGIMYIFPFFEYTYTPISTASLVSTNSTITTCHMKKRTSHLLSTFCVAHTWAQIIFTSLLPWFLITFPDIGLLWKLKQADDNRKMLQDGAVADGEKGLDESLIKTRRTQASQRRRRTWIIFIVVSMVWLVEIPFAICFTKYLAHTTSDVMRNSLGTGVVFSYLLKYITYPIIFVIYCLMSQRFRLTLTDTFVRRQSTLTSESSTKFTRSDERK